MVCGKSKEAQKYLRNKFRLICIVLACSAGCLHHERDERENLHYNGQQLWNWERNCHKFGKDGRPRCYGCSQPRARRKSTVGNSKTNRKQLYRSNDLRLVVHGFNQALRAGIQEEIRQTRCAS